MTMLKVRVLITLINLEEINEEDFGLVAISIICESTVLYIFIIWIMFLYQMKEMLGLLPSRDLVIFFMPAGFKKRCPNTRIIVDYTATKNSNYATSRLEILQKLIYRRKLIQLSDTLF